jgi:hypothetical protein
MNMVGAQGERLLRQHRYNEKANQELRAWAATKNLPPPPVIKQRMLNYIHFTEEKWAEVMPDILHMRHVLKLSWVDIGAKYGKAPSTIAIRVKNAGHQVLHKSLKPSHATRVRAGDWTAYDKFKERGDGVADIAKLFNMETRELHALLAKRNK